MTGIGTFVKTAIDRLSGLYSKEESRAIAVKLLVHYLNIPEYKYISEPETEIPEDKMKLLSDALYELSRACPLQYVIGYTEFVGLKIKVGKGVLIPRPETEEMFYIIKDRCREMIEKNRDGFNILDVCTGTGCLAYSLASSFPEAQVYACDISEEALKIACKQKVKLHGSRPVFFHADVLSAPPAGLPEFDVIVSNPPYVCESEKSFMRYNVLLYEPHLALFVPDEDPLKFYKALLNWTSLLLKPSGKCWFEINEAYGEDVRKLISGKGYSTKLLQDINGKDRGVEIGSWRKKEA